MGNIKRKIKSLLPDKVVYAYIVLKIVPKYIKAKSELKTKSFPDIKIMSNEETIDKIIGERKSLCRFGDGEFTWMMDRKIASFQDYSAELGLSLRNAIKNTNKDLLIGIPGGMIDASKCNLQARFHWAIVKNDLFYDICKFLNTQRVYCDASITRPYIDYRDREFSEKSFRNLKRMWDMRNIVIVEGSKTKLGVGNDLFDNVKSIKRIICPAQNAFDRRDEICASIRRNVSQDDLILAALGPTATILATRMCEEGFQIIDIGHIDVEYMWFLNHSILRDAIVGKSVNESNSRDCSEIYDNEESYKKSIIDRID